MKLEKTAKFIFSFLIVGLLFSISNITFADTGVTGYDLYTGVYNMSSTEIKALSTNPVTIIPAQGINIRTELVSWCLKFNYSSPQYTGGSNLTLKYGTSQITSNALGSSIITGTTVGNIYCGALNVSGLYQPLNDIITLSATAPFLSGNGTIDVYYTYRKYNFSTNSYVLNTPETGCTSFSCLTDIPTTLAGYGITDSFTLPTQTDNDGKFLTTDGVYPSWASVSGGTGGDTINNINLLTDETEYILTFLLIGLLFGVVIHFTSKLVKKII